MKKFLPLALGVSTVAALFASSALHAQSNSGGVKDRAKGLKKKVEADPSDDAKPSGVKTNAPNPKVKPAPGK